MKPIVIGGLAAAGLGGLFLLSKRNKASDGPGGQGALDSTSNFGTINDQNTGLNVAVSDLSSGPNLSFTDPSFFGQGPLSLWTAGPMDYSNNFGGNRRRRRGRDRDFDGRGPGRVGDDFPPGAGGFGEHRGKGPHFPSAPSGGEGFDNGGQSFIGGSQPTRTGGNPWQQQTTVGTQGQQYLVQKGDTLQGVAAKLWGRGADASPIQQANQGVLGGSASGQLAAGLLLTIPGAGHNGPPAPGGPSGNGIGGGSIGADGFNPGVAGAPYGGDSNTQDHPGAGTSSAGAPGGGSPTAGQSWGNSSRAKRGGNPRHFAGVDMGDQKKGNR